MTAGQIVLVLFALGGALVLSAAFWTSIALLIVGGMLLLAAFTAGPTLDRRRHQ